MSTTPLTSRRIAAALAVGLTALAASAPAAPARAVDGTIGASAGTVSGLAGDGGPAVQAKMNTPRDVAYVSSSSYLVADFANDRIRQVLPSGNITTVAGSSEGFSGDGGSAQDAELNRPRGVTALPGGGYLIADTFNDRVRRVAADGTISTLAGSLPGLSGDGGPAGLARLTQPSDTAVESDGSILIADTGNDRIRRVSPSGTITTVAGSARGFGGDGGPATAAQLNQPRDVEVASDGAILIADTGNSRVRRVGANGTITTVAGAGAGLSGDGDPARTAQLNAPFSVASLPHGGFLVADTSNDRVRRVTPLGAILTVAGTSAGNAGNGGLAKQAQLRQPGAITVAPGGGVLVADTGNATVRLVSAVGAVPPAVVGHSLGVAPATGSVTVQPAGTGQALALQEEDLVPTGSKVDATTGRMELTVARDGSGIQQTAQLYAGPFTATQGTAGQPYTTFSLPKATGCSSKRSAAARPGTASAARRKRTRKPRRVWVKEKGGRWRTSTGSTSASAIGTDWLTTNLCDGTRVTVRQGKVRVRDRVRHRTVLVSAGQSYRTVTR